MFRVWSPQPSIAVSPLVDFTPSPNTRLISKKALFITSRKPSPGNSGFPIKDYSNAERKADPGNSGKFIPGIANGRFEMIFLGGREWPKLMLGTGDLFSTNLRRSNVLVNNYPEHRRFL